MMKSKQNCGARPRRWVGKRLAESTAEHVTVRGAEEDNPGATHWVVARLRERRPG